MFPKRSVDVCKNIVIPVYSKPENNCELRNRLLYVGWLKTLMMLQGSRPNHVRVEIHVVVSFGPRHVTRSPLIGKRS